MGAPVQQGGGFQGGIAQFQSYVGVAEPLGAVSRAGQFILKMNNVDNLLYASLNGGAFFQLAGATGALTTLDLAYDGLTGSGSGRTVTVDAGVVQLTVPDAVANQGALGITYNRLSGTGGSAIIAIGTTTGAFTPTGAIEGLLVDLNTNYAASAVSLTGVNVLLGPSSNVGARGARIRSFATGAGAACLALDPTPAAGAGVRALVVTMTANAQGDAIAVSDNALIADQTAALAITSAPAAVASIDRRALAAVFNSALTVAANINTGVAGSSYVQITQSVTWTPGGANTLTLQRSLLRVDNVPATAAAATATIVDSTALLTLNHAPTVGAGSTYTDTARGLVITMSPGGAAAVTGASITMSANATGAGLLITHNRATAAAGTVALRLAGANQAVTLEFTDGQNVGVSNAAEGRLRFNAATNKLQGSENGGAWTNLF